MAMSDCPRCWNTPCGCGWEYRNYSIEALDWRIKMFSAIKEYKETHPDAKFSYWCEDKETENDKELILMLNRLYAQTIHGWEERRNYD